jgi:hypothetical protein
MRNQRERFRKIRNAENKVHSRKQLFFTILIKVIKALTITNNYLVFVVNCLSVARKRPIRKKKKSCTIILFFNDYKFSSRTIHSFRNIKLCTTLVLSTFQKNCKTNFKLINKPFFAHFN